MTDRAGTNAFDRSGVAAIGYRNADYVNVNDRCIPATSTSPPPPDSCALQSKPPCRTQQWLQSRGYWPLTQVGRIKYLRPGLFGKGFPGFGEPGKVSPILRPPSTTNPDRLFVHQAACYLEYARK